MQIITRDQWGARHPAGFGPAPLPATDVWLHHSVTVAPDLIPPFDDDDAAMRLLESIGQQRFGGGVSYTFAVMPDGRIYEGHGVDRQGSHTAGRNSTARAIVLVGNYDLDEPTAQQIESTADLLAHGWRLGWWAAPGLAGGHRQVPGASTVCPGRYGLAAIAAINRRATVLAAANTPTEGDDEMALTDAEADLIAKRIVARLLDQRAPVNLTKIQNIAKAADYRIDQLDDKTLAALATIDDRLEDVLRLLGGVTRTATAPPPAPARLVTVSDELLDDVGGPDDDDVDVPRRSTFPGGGF